MIQEVDFLFKCYGWPLLLLLLHMPLSLQKILIPSVIGKKSMTSLWHRKGVKSSSTMAIKPCKETTDTCKAPKLTVLI